MKNKISIKVWLLILIVIVLLGGYAAVAGSLNWWPMTYAWKDYTNTSLGFELDYPKSIAIYEYESGISISQRISEETCNKDQTILGCSVDLNVIVGEYPNGIQQWGGLTGDYKRVIFDGINAWERNGPRLEQGERNEGYIQQKKIVFESRNAGRVYVYEIKIEYPKSLGNEIEVQNYLKIYDRILSTFEVMK